MTWLSRHRKLAEIEQQIDEEIYCLYGISDEDRAAIEAELDRTRNQQRQRRGK